MEMSRFLKSLGVERSNNLPVYSTLPVTPSTPASHYEHPRLANKSLTSRFQLPTLSRFLADFTLGFADGLTVPFALTAGLSSLGHTETVIYAGMAEICAGSISMGIGGYLSARGEARSAEESHNEAQGEEDVDQEKAAALEKSAAIEDYLAPLRLPQDVYEAVREHVQSRPMIVDALQQKARDDANDKDEEKPCSPILSGLSVAVGYLLGGLLPLFPYFFVNQVGSGLRWSFGVCVLALFAFGFGKHYLLQEEEENKRWVMTHQHKCEARWKRIKSSLWEGIQMVILGSIAALAAVSCVQMFEGIVS